MDLNTILGYLLGVLVGISLGLVGSGGSILTVPIMVYVLAVEPVLATAYSLFVVGSSALVGGIKNAAARNVDFKTVAVFGIPSLIAAYSVRAFVIPIIPEIIDEINGFAITKAMLLMVLFALVMLAASLRMIRSAIADEKQDLPTQMHYQQLFFMGIGTGILSGAVGAGGGFIIIPALVFLAKVPMKRAVGTSLFIIAIQSLAGFTGDLGQRHMDWLFLTTFAVASIVGIFIGTWLSKKISGERLKTGFGWFILIMGSYIILKELVLR